MQERVKYVFSAYGTQHQGGRPYQEDRFAVEPCALGVFDGHGARGAEVAEICQRTFEVTTQDPAFTSDAWNIQLLCERMEKAALTARGTQFGGTTAAMAFIRTDLRPGTDVPRMRVVLANVGDSRAALFRPDVDSLRYIPALETRYHDVSQFDETARMIAAGSRIEHRRLVWDEGEYRISSAMTRALGYGGAGGVIATPDVYVVEAYPRDVVVLASDGFWETMSSRDVCDVLNTYQRSLPALAEISTKLLCTAMMTQLMVQRALAASADRKWDNATVIVARMSTR